VHASVFNAESKFCNVMFPEQRLAASVETLKSVKDDNQIE
jgi:hypothetical protein